MNIFEVRKNCKTLYAYTRIGMFLYGLSASSKYDDEVKEIVAEVPENIEFSLTIFHLTRYIICKKQNGVLEFEIKKNFLGNGTYAMFKSLDGALPVLSSKESFSDAFIKSKIILKGDPTFGRALVKMLDIAQAYVASSIRRKKYLHNRKIDKKSAVKIKKAVLTRGLL